MPRRRHTQRTNEGAGRVSSTLLQNMTRSSLAAVAFSGAASSARTWLQYPCHARTLLAQPPPSNDDHSIVVHVKAFTWYFETMLQSLSNSALRFWPDGFAMNSEKQPWGPSLAFKPTASDQWYLPQCVGTRRSFDMRVMRIMRWPQ